MALLKEYLLAERKKILDQNIRFTVIGRREGLAATKCWPRSTRTSG